MNQWKVYEWKERFKERRSVDDVCSGRSSIVTEQADQRIRNNLIISTDEMS
jgi:hypothetical protein